MIPLQTEYFWPYSANPKCILDYVADYASHSHASLVKQNLVYCEFIYNLTVMCGSIANNRLTIAEIDNHITCVALVSLPTFRNTLELLRFFSDFFLLLNASFGLQNQLLSQNNLLRRANYY